MKNNTPFGLRNICFYIHSASSEINILKVFLHSDDLVRSRVAHIYFSMKVNILNLKIIATRKSYFNSCDYKFSRMSPYIRPHYALARI